MELYRNQELINRAKELFIEGYNILEALKIAEKELDKQEEYMEGIK